MDGSAVDRSWPVGPAEILVVTTSTGRRDLTLLAAAAIDLAIDWVVMGPADVTVPPGLRHVVANTRGYATSRNAALGLAISEGRRRVLFFDDDQVPVAGWWAAHRAYEAAHPDVTVLLGRVLAVALEATDVPAEEIRPVLTLRAGEFSGHVYSGNTMIDVDFVQRHGLRFDIALDDLGGEDTAFFAAVRRAGGTVHAVPGALAVEIEPADRLTLSARFRSGREMARRRRALGLPYWRGPLTRTKATLKAMAFGVRGLVAADARLLSRAAFQAGLATG